MYAEFDPVQLETPSREFESETALKEWVWEHHKDRFLEAMHIRHEASKDQTYHHRRLQVLDHVMRVQRRYLLSEDPKVVYGSLLESVLELTGSEYGFIGEVIYGDSGQVLCMQTHAFTNIAWDGASRKLLTDTKKNGLQFYNMNTLFGAVIKTKKPVLSNNPVHDDRSGGLPAGHPPLDRFLGIPFFSPNGDLLGLVGIANHPGGYCQDDIRLLEPFTLTCSNLIHAYQHFQKSEHFINILEEKVEERTRELKVSNERLELARQKQLHQFACCSHELRTPLNCVIGLSNLLLEAKMKPSHKNSLKMIVNSSDLLLTVVDDILDYAKLETGNVDIEMRNTNLQETLVSVVQSIETKAETKRVLIKTSFDNSLPEFLRIDGRRLQQVLYNLLGNGIKFSNEGGVVELSVSLYEKSSSKRRKFRQKDHESNSSKRQPRQEKSAKKPDELTRCPFHRPVDTPQVEIGPPHHPFARVNSDSSIGSIDSNTSTDTASDCSWVEQPPSVANPPPRTMIRFLVKNYGKGIDTKDLGNIFEPFHQGGAETGRLYGGTGLGLAITSKLATAMGGQVAVDSCPGEWAEFTVDLPFYGNSVDEKAISSGFKSTTILYIDAMVKEEQNRVSDVFTHFGVQHVSCSSIGAVTQILSNDAKRGSPGIRKGDTAWILLLNEDLYNELQVRALRLLVPGAALVSFGPKFSVPESDSHIRSLVQVLPSVMLKSLHNCLVDKLNAHKKNDTPMPRINADDHVGLKKLRVLVAEDNIINQKVIMRMLQRLGLETIDLVDNGEKAVEKESSNEYDVVLMDMQMPTMDGIEACRQICRRQGGHARAPVVFVTAHASGDYESEGKKAGGRGFLTKPVSVNTIKECLETLCCKGHVDSVI